MKNVYLIVQAKNYTDGYPLSVFKTKKIAVKRCRQDGYKYSKQYDLWSNETHWRTINRIEFYKE